MDELTLEQLKLLIAQTKELRGRTEKAEADLVNNPEYRASYKKLMEYDPGRPEREQYQNRVNKMMYESFLRTFDAFAGEKGNALSSVLKKVQTELSGIKDHANLDYAKESMIVNNAQFAAIYENKYEEKYFELEGALFKENFAKADPATQLRMMGERIKSPEFRHLTKELDDFDRWMKLVQSEPDEYKTLDVKQKLHHVEGAIKNFQHDAGMEIKEIDSRIHAEEFARIQNFAKAMGIKVEAVQDQNSIRVLDENNQALRNVKVEFDQASFRKSQVTR